MGPLTVALEQLLLDKIAGAVGPAKKSKPRCSPWAVSVLLGFIGICFFIASAFIWMLHNYTPELATAFTGVLVMVLGLLIALGAWCIHEYKKNRIKHYGNEFTDVLHTLVGPLMDELEDPIRENPKMALGVAALAGFLLSRNF